MRTIRLTFSLMLLAALAGCLGGDMKGLGVGKRPIIPFVSDVPDEKPSDVQRSQLTACAKTYPEAYALIHDRLEAHKRAAKLRSAAIEVYNREAMKINRDQLVNVLGWERDRANSAVYADLIDAGYPQVEAAKLMP